MHKRKADVETRNREIDNKVRKKNAKYETEAEENNKKAKRSRLLKVIFIAFIISIVLTIASQAAGAFILFFPIAFLVLMLIIKPKQHVADHEEPELIEYKETPLKSYTFLPSGTIQCSSCGTKTKIDNKEPSSTCPNCHSEIFVISNMEDNVVVKSIARSE